MEQKERQPTFQRLRIAALGSVAALALGGSGVIQEGTAHAKSVPSAHEAQTHRPGHTEAIGQMAVRCGLRYVQPNKHFTRDNPNLSKQVGLINELYNTNSEVTLGDVWTAGQIIYSSNQDPRYAIAMQRTRSRAATGRKVTKSTFLATKPPATRPCGDRNHISKSASSNQLERTAATGQDLVRRVGSRLGERASRILVRAFEVVKGEVEELQSQRP
jgi:hypothetical protein